MALMHRKMFEVSPNRTFQMLYKTIWLLVMLEYLYPVHRLLDTENVFIVSIEDKILMNFVQQAVQCTVDCTTDTHIETH